LRFDTTCVLRCVLCCREYQYGSTSRT
jgi:hypothetical protein